MPARRRARAGTSTCGWRRAPCRRRQRGRVARRPANVPPQGDDCQEADDADGDDGGLDDAGGDVAEGDALVLPLDDGEDRDGGADARDGEEHLKERAGEDAGVGAGAEDVVGVVENGAVKAERGNRGDEGEDEKHAGDERALSGRVHVGLLGAAGVFGARVPAGLSAAFQTAVRNGQALVFRAWSSGFSGRWRSWRAAGQLHVGGTRERALLAILLIHAGEVVSADRLIEELWGSDLPGNPANALQVVVSRVRKALENSAGPGGSLPASPATCSTCARTSWMPAGSGGWWRRPGGRPPTCRAGCRCLRRRWACGAARRSRSSRRRASPGRDRPARGGADPRRRDEGGSGAGARRHAELVGELTALVAANPLRERLRGHLMLALYRSGRQGEALRVFQEGRGVLADELGVDPGPELRELHQQILLQAASLMAAPEAGGGAPGQPAGPGDELRRTARRARGGGKPAARVAPGDPDRPWRDRQDQAGH